MRDGGVYRLQVLEEGGYGAGARTSVAYENAELSVANREAAEQYVERALAAAERDELDYAVRLPVSLLRCFPHPFQLYDSPSVLS